MGFCIACFLRDTAGALRLHSVSTVQYVRPEIIGTVIGALLTSIVTKEYASKGGSAPMTRFILGMCVMIGAMIFLGCPLRMALRIAGGDLNAVVGLFGFAAGILLGVFFLIKGFSLKRTYSLSNTDGFILPSLSLLLLIALLFSPAILAFSQEGPGAAHAPVPIAIVAGIIMGSVGYISRLCFTAGIRDSFLFKDYSMFSVFVTIIVVGTIGNILFGKFNLGFENQPIAHSDSMWNFIGLALVGFGSVLLGGCPFRQLILAGSGNSDSAITVLGIICGGAVSHNLNLVSSARGVTENGKIGFALAVVVVLFIAIYNTYFNKKAGESSL
jgi:YedE family putative selenium metabolism protein